VLSLILFHLSIIFLAVVLKANILMAHHARIVMTPAETATMQALTAAIVVKMGTILMEPSVMFVMKLVIPAMVQTLTCVILVTTDTILTELPHVLNVIMPVKPALVLVRVHA